MNELARHLRAMIRETGPISLGAYMSVALGHPVHGYYRCKEAIGAAGDFITAPEISQMFGELIGLWCVQRWRDMGNPAEFMLCELGPGRGTLMADALRAAKVDAGFLRAMRIHLVEISETLRAKQQSALAYPVTWHTSVTGLPPLPALILANEFFDALPIRQFQKCETGWHERLITFDPQADKFQFILTALPLRDDKIIPPAMQSAAPGEIAEICPFAQAIVQMLAGHIRQHGGAALIIDYGPHRSAPGDSFQAMRGQKYCDPLESPGEADLTAHVDFQSLADIAQKTGCRVDGPTGQGPFLLQLGIAERAQRLASAATPHEQTGIHIALDRLTNPTRMGSLFKAMALRHPDLNPSLGF